MQSVQGEERCRDRVGAEQGWLELAPSSSGLEIGDNGGEEGSKTESNWIESSPPTGRVSSVHMTPFLSLSRFFLVGLYITYQVCSSPT